MNDTFGIHDIAFKAPSLYLSIEDLATARDIDPAKLIKGLGLTHMSVCDADEDIVTLAAGAVLRLLEQNPDIKPADIGRIYVGTESSIDGSKPIGTYVHALVEQDFSAKGIDASALRHTDVIDMTFACIGAVDAMHNSLYYLYAEPDKVAIVVAADIANYDLASSGEYTQGAGATAVLLKKNPALLSLSTNWGTSTKSEHDFFKPIRLKIEDGKLIELHDEKPIFDGQFSNFTYQNRITEAWQHFRNEQLLENYDQLLFHLPYAYHGRRIISSLLVNELKEADSYSSICADQQINPADDDAKKQFVKSPFYKKWTTEKVAAGDRLSSKMGNLYTASIFLSLVSYFTSSEVVAGNSLLCFAYGSGSKAKVFEAEVQEAFANQLVNWKIDEQLDARTPISFDQYIALRTHKVTRPLGAKKEVTQTASGITETNRFERSYELGG
ncbi:MAG: hydroxymethylglutaryl-CoA synthase [Bacteroidia bacterium]|jgi:hydroxymethylglutaryl-CoA synthase